MEELNVTWVSLSVMCLADIQVDMSIGTYTDLT